jgi:hypothetical protein
MFWKTYIYFFSKDMWIVTLETLCEFVGTDQIERSIIFSQRFLFAWCVGLEKCSIHIFLDCMYLLYFTQVSFVW